MAAGTETAANAADAGMPTARGSAVAPGTAARTADATAGEASAARVTSDVTARTSEAAAGDHDGNVVAANVTPVARIITAGTRDVAAGALDVLAGGGATLVGRIVASLDGTVVAAVLLVNRAACRWDDGARSAGRLRQVPRPVAPLRPAARQNQGGGDQD